MLEILVKRISIPNVSLTTLGICQLPDIHSVTSKEGKIINYIVFPSSNMISNTSGKRLPILDESLMVSGIRWLFVTIWKASRVLLPLNPPLLQNQKGKENEKWERGRPRRRRGDSSPSVPVARHHFVFVFRRRRCISVCISLMWFFYLDYTLWIIVITIHYTNSPSKFKHFRLQPI